MEALLGAAGCAQPERARTVPAAAPTPAPAPAADAPPPGLRLPRTVLPTHEALELHLEPRRPSYRGHARIDVTVAAPTAVVWLHAEGLEISAGAGVRVLHAPGGLLGLAFNAPLPAGEHSLDLDFTGEMGGPAPEGLYRAAEADDATYVFTRFDAAGARRAFPCFDEPAFKIPWSVTLVVPPGEQAYAGAPLLSRARGPDGQSAATFADTPPLPPALLGFAVGPFESVAAGVVGARRASLRFLVPRGRGAATHAAAAALPRLVDRLEDVTGVPYPFAKLDVVVVPHAAGVAAVPGLVALDQGAAIIEPDDETVARARRLVERAAPALAALWTGALVTPAERADAGLADGLAEWAARAALVGYEPGWRPELDAAQARARGLGFAEGGGAVRTVDGERAARAAWGATVFAMFERWIGVPRFRQLVRHFLEGHAGRAVTESERSRREEATLERGAAAAREGAASKPGAAGAPAAQRANGTYSESDLIAAIDPSSDGRIGAALRGFLDDTGAPAVAAEASCVPGKPTAIELSQRALGTGAAGVWTIPVCVAWGDGAERARSCRLLSAAHDTLFVDHCPVWVLPNDGALGAYRSDVSAAAAAALLATGKLSVAERIALVDDVEALRPLSEALTLVPLLAADPDPAVVARAARLAAAVPSADLVPELRAHHERFVRKVFGARARALGWRRRPREPLGDTELRPLLLPFVVARGADAELAEEARALASRWLDDRRELEPVTVDAVLEAAGATRSAPLWRKLQTAAGAARDRRERGRLLAALGGFDDPDLAQAALVLLRAPALDLTEGLPLYWRALAGRRSRELAYAFLKQNWDDLGARLGASERIALLGAIATFCDEAHRADAQAAFAARAEAVPGGAAALATALARVDACRASARADARALEAFLARQ
jgi:aminopeptidase N